MTYKTKKVTCDLYQEDMTVFLDNNENEIVLTVNEDYDSDEDEYKLWFVCGDIFNLGIPTYQLDRLIEYFKSIRDKQQNL